MAEIIPEDVAPVPTAEPATDSQAELTSLIAEDGDVPDEVLRIPAFNAVLEGKPGAIYAGVGEKSPELATILKHQRDLVKAGFGFYQAESKKVNVLFNAMFISPEELAKADKEGRLDEVAASFGEVKSSYDTLISEDQAKAGKTAVAPSAPGPSAAPAPASVLNKLATARIDNLAPGAPTSGASPGQGRILNSLRKPVV